MHRAATGGPQRTGRQVALRGGDGDVVGEQGEQPVVAERGAEQVLAVPGEDPAPGGGVQPGGLVEAVDDGVGERLLKGPVVVVALEVLAAGGRGEPGGLDHAADEAGPAGQQVAGVLGEQHAAQVDGEVAVVGAAVRAAVLDPEQADRVGAAALHRGDGEGGERLEAAAEGGGEAHPRGVPVPRDLLPPGHRYVVDRPVVVADVHRDGQQDAVPAEHLAQRVLVGEVGVLGLQGQLDDAAGGGAGGGRLDAVLLAAAAAVAVAEGRFAVRGGGDGDLVGDRERRQEAEAERADQLVVAGDLAQQPGVAGADGGEVGVDLRFGQARAGVLDADGAPGRVAADPDQRGVAAVRILQPAPGVRVVGVLDEFSQGDQGRGVEVRGEDAHQTAEVDLGRTQIFGGHGTGVVTFRHEATVCQYDYCGDHPLIPRLLPLRPAGLRDHPGTGETCCHTIGRIVPHSVESGL